MQEWQTWGKIYIDFCYYLVFLSKITDAFLSNFFERPDCELGLLYDIIILANFAHAAPEHMCEQIQM